MVRLFIENIEVELTDEVQFAITKQFEDLSNPTAIINEWSKTVSIPFTHKNNELFGHIYSPDRSILSGSGSIGIYFNPLRKLSFRLIWNSVLLLTGYAKMNEIKQVDNKGTYEITLFGQIGKLFQEMQKITFDSTSASSYMYYLNGADYVDEYISKELVYSSWTSTGQTTGTLKKKTDTGYVVTDIIGFAPNNSFSKDFSYDTYESSTGIARQFTNSLSNNGFQTDTGINPESVIPDGLLPREIGEYRSYYQLPFIYWNKLFQIFQKKAETVTGYTFDLDSNWFNSSNPYWYNLVYMLKSKDVEKGTTYTNTYAGINYRYNLGYWPWDPNSGSVPDWTVPYTSDLHVDGTKTEQQSIIGSDNKTYYFGNYSTITFDYNIKSMLIANHEDQTMSSLQTLRYTVTAIGQNGHTVSQEKTFRRGDCTVDGIYIHLPDFTMYFSCSKKDFGTWVKFQISTKWDVAAYPYQNIDYTPTSSGDVRLYNNGISLKTVLLGDDWARSGARFTLNDLWNNEYNLFGEILKYCKMYRIGIFTDDYNKKLYFKPFSTYFSDYTTEDWTDRVDKSKDFIITPVTFSNKYILFNYKDSNTKLGKEYKDKYGVNYGDYRLITEYNFNTETTNLFEDITPSIVNTDNVLSWINLFSNHSIAYSFPSEIYVYNKDADKKQVDVFGAYFFHNGKANFSTETGLYMTNVIISDDSSYQRANNTYFYNQTSGDGNTKLVTTYPKLDIVRGDNMCVFNIPKYNYTYNNNYSGKKSIYTNFWKDYIDERYNVQNKKITCYLNIKPTDFTSFEFNKLIKIDNQLCIVNKIYDYDVTSNESTKVELITIYNLEGYTTNEYN